MGASKHSTPGSLAYCATHASALATLEELRRRSGGRAARISILVVVCLVPEQMRPQGF